MPKVFIEREEGSKPPYLEINYPIQTEVTMIHSSRKEAQGSPPRASSINDSMHTDSRSIFHYTPVLCENILNRLPVVNRTLGEDKKFAKPTRWALEMAILCDLCRTLLITLAYHANEDGRVECHLDKLAETCLFSIAETKSSLNKLRESKIITICPSLSSAHLAFDEIEDTALLYVELRIDQPRNQFNIEGEHQHG